jgi:hypothetical protein
VNKGQRKTPEQAAAAKAAGRKTLDAEKAAAERAVALVAGEQARLKAEAAARRASASTSASTSASRD